MHHARYRPKYRKRWPSTGTGTPLQSAPSGPAPLRAKIQGYFQEISSPRQTHGELSSSDIKEVPAEEIPHSEPSYIPRRPVQTPVEKLPSLSPHPPAKPRRRHKYKRIQLPSPFQLLVEPTPLESDSAIGLPLQPESPNSQNLLHKEYIHPSLPRASTPVSRSPSLDGNELSLDHAGDLVQVDTAVESNPPRVSSRVIHATTRTYKVIEFDYSNPIKGNSHDIKIDNLLSLRCDVNDTSGITLATSHFLAYARASQPLERDGGLVHLKSCSGGFQTCLPLPAAFGHSDYIIDMAGKGDHLAITTSGGGALVWEIPELVDQQYFSPTIRLQILPGTPCLKKVKWHSSRTLAFASSSQVYLLDFHEAKDIFCGLPVYLDKLKQVAKVFEVISPIASFAFDYKKNSIAILSLGGAICFFDIHGNYPIWKTTIRGHGDPSSLDIYDWGMLIGWKQGTILQLFSPLSANVISTLQFVNRADPEAGNSGRNHAYAYYDSWHRTLWVAHSARPSLLAVRMPLEVDNTRLEDAHTNMHQVFEQLVEIPTLFPAFRISLAESSVNDSERPGSIRLYAVNSYGVDCITVPQTALENTYATRALAVGTFPPGQPGTEALKVSYQPLPSEDPGSWVGAEPLEPNQLETPAPHPVLIDRDTKKKSGAQLSPLLQVQPSGIRKVKWYHGGKLALLSNSEVRVFDIHQLQATFEGLFVPWKNLTQLAQRYSVPSFIVNFAFDARNAAIGAISIDSVLSLWSMETQRTIWQEKIPGNGDPSSIHFVDDAVIIGRNRGNTIQLLALRSTDVLATLHFVHPMDPTANTGARMYAQLCYDSQLRTLWVINSERSSLIAVRASINFDHLDANKKEAHGTFEKIAEFPTPAFIEGITTLSDGNTQGPSLAVMTTVSLETRVYLLTIDQSVFEASLQTVSAKPALQLKPDSLQGVSPSLEDELRETLDPLIAYHDHYLEPEYQGVPPPSKMVPKPSNLGTNNTRRPVDIVRPTEMSTDEMFACLIRHGCPDLTQSINPDTYSNGFLVSGGFGDIWKGKLFDGTDVAIKVWRFRTLQEDEGKDVK
ncbi:hypothetical protein FRC11_005540, partial [Ceratobasidium sp. 423]